jgi:hypothetical protein
MKAKHKEVWKMSIKELSEYTKKNKKIVLIKQGKLAGLKKDE